VTAAGLPAAAADSPYASISGGDQAASLQVAFEACLSSLEDTGGEEAGASQRRGRQAALAVADALLEIHGIAPAVEHFAPRGAVDVAREVLSHLDTGEPADAISHLARMFEGAVGLNGRQDQGAVYTPADVVRFMVREGLSARIAAELSLEHDDAQAVVEGDVAPLAAADRDRLGKLLNGLRVVDPAAGTGAFLVGAAGEIARMASRLRESGVPVSAALQTPHGALKRCCHGFEVDPDATRMAEVILALSCSGKSKRTVAGVVTTRNTLLGGLDHPSAPNGWDVVLMNPPYVGEKHLRKRLGAELQAALRARDGFSGDLLSHFVLRALEGTRDGGALSAIVSDTAFTMASASRLRSALTDGATIVSLAWCRPFAVTAQGGVVTAIRGKPEMRGEVRCYEAGRRAQLDRVSGKKIRRANYYDLPGRPLFRPSAAATSLVKRWTEIEDLDEMWRLVGRSRSGLSATAAARAPGEWTLLGSAVKAGQGLATGDDRRFVGFLAGTEAATDAIRRQRQILEALREAPERLADWRFVKRMISRGDPIEDALLALLERDAEASLPGRKPFRVVPDEQVRRSPLSEHERHYGISAGPGWVPYETSDRSSPGGGRWMRPTSVVLDWSADAVDLLRTRQANGPKRPVLRHEDLWFRGGVTHNRISSYLRARLLPRHAIFSSESPCYVPTVPWLNNLSLLALLNSPVVEFMLKTFLASRNHVELGHLLRLPVPVPTEGQRRRLEKLADAGVDAARSGRQATEVERDLDLLTRKMYGVRANAKLQIVR
jgi:hypothetical protein